MFLKRGGRGFLSWNTIDSFYNLYSEGGIRKGKGKEEKEEKREKGREERKGAGKETGG